MRVEGRLAHNRLYRPRWPREAPSTCRPLLPTGPGDGLPWRVLEPRETAGGRGRVVKGSWNRGDGKVFTFLLESNLVYCKSTSTSQS